MRKTGAVFDALRGLLERAGNILRRECGDLVILKQKLRHIEACELVRAGGTPQDRAWDLPRQPFVLCALPIKQPSAGTLLHSRGNGDFLIEDHRPPEIPEIWASLRPRLPGADLPRYAGHRAGSRTIAFPSAAEMLDTFGMHQGGSHTGDSLERSSGFRRDDPFRQRGSAGARGCDRRVTDLVFAPPWRSVTAAGLSHSCGAQ